MVDFHAELLGRVLNDRSKPPKKKSKFGRLQLTADAQDVLGQDDFDGQGDEEEEDAEAEEEFEDIDLLKLHGSMTQKDRMDVFRTFRDSSSGVLLCTDVAARGLDLPQVDWIVQYNPPISKADYIHRYGKFKTLKDLSDFLPFFLFISELVEQPGSGRRDPLSSFCCPQRPLLSKSWRRKVSSWRR